MSALAKQKFHVIVIGISTGGPEALAKLIQNLPTSLNVPILIVQHIPQSMAHSLAAQLDKLTSLQVKVAESGEAVLPNTVYIAPGGSHMGVIRADALEKQVNKKAIRISLNQGPLENSCRPSADVLFRSVAKTYEKNILALVMTGMGHDALEGVRIIKAKAGNYCITQSEESCVIYGMPKAVVDENLSDEIVELNKLPERLMQLLQGGA